MTEQVFTFGTATWRPVTDNFLMVPLPVTAISGDWVHIPYSSTNVFETDNGKLQTVWQIRIWLPDNAALIAIKGLLGQFALLVSPYGHFTALLRDMSGFQKDTPGAYTDGTDEIPVIPGAWRGQVTWEWSNQ